MELTSLLQLVDKFQQVCKIDNLQQVCGVFGCVYRNRRGKLSGKINLRSSLLGAPGSLAIMTSLASECRETHTNFVASLLIQAHKRSWNY